MRLQLLVFCCITLAVFVRAQDPCANKEFPYRYIDANCVEAMHCAKDPTQTHPIWGKVAKWPVNSNVGFALESNYTADGCFVPDNAAVRACIVDAISQWSSICPPGTVNIFVDQLGTCGMKIRYTSNKNDFYTGGHTENLGLASPVWDCDANLVCFGDPYRGEIILNRTPDFLDGTKDTPPHQPMLPCPPTDPGCTTTKLKSNLCATITHEIGHMLGLLHTKFNKDSQPCESSSDQPEDLMQDGTGIDGCKSSKLSFNDRCMFQKLYCKGNILSVDKQASKSIIHFTLHPNPANHAVTIIFENEKSDVSQVEFVNALGITVKTVTIQHGPGIVEEMISVDDLDGGAYYIRLENSLVKNTMLLHIAK